MAFGDDELLHFYEMLRPGRSSAAELDSLASMLAERGAERCANLVREARDAYLRRGLISLANPPRGAPPINHDRTRPREEMGR